MNLTVIEHKRALQRIFAWKRDQEQITAERQQRIQWAQQQWQIQAQQRQQQEQQLGDASSEELIAAAVAAFAGSALPQAVQQSPQAHQQQQYISKTSPLPSSSNLSSPVSLATSGSARSAPLPENLGTGIGAGVQFPLAASAEAAAAMVAGVLQKFTNQQQQQQGQQQQQQQALGHLLSAVLASPSEHGREFSPLAQQPQQQQGFGSGVSSTLQQGTSRGSLQAISPSQQQQHQQHQQQQQQQWHLASSVQPPTAAAAAARPVSLGMHSSEADYHADSALDLPALPQHFRGRDKESEGVSAAGPLPLPHTNPSLRLATEASLLQNGSGSLGGIGSGGDIDEETLAVLQSVLQGDTRAGGLAVQQNPSGGGQGQGLRFEELLQVTSFDPMFRPEGLVGVGSLGEVSLQLGLVTGDDPQQRQQQQAT